MSDFIVNNSYIILPEVCSLFGINEKNNKEFVLKQACSLKYFDIVNQKSKNICIQFLEVPKKYFPDSLKVTISSYDKSELKDVDFVYILYRKASYMSSPIINTYIDEYLCEEKYYNYICDKINTKTKDDISNYMLTSFGDNYFYVPFRKIYIQNSSNIIDSSIQKDVLFFINNLTSNTTLTEYIKLNNVSEDILYNCIPDYLFTTIFKFLDRLETIIKTPSLNKKYIFENECHPIFKYLVTNGDPDSFKDEIEELTQKIYSIVPFKSFKYTKIDTLEKLKEISDDVEDLQKVNNNFFKDNVSIKPDTTIFKNTFSPIIKEIIPISSQYKTIITNYVYNNWGYNHPGRKPRLINIFEVIYEDKYSKVPSLKQDNRWLLVHGSPFINWKSIIGGGLELPKGGGMFGKGIYFANCFSKSYAYTGHRPDSNGCMGFYEVNLGVCKKLLQADSSLTSHSMVQMNVDSIWGQGKNSYKECEYINIEGNTVKVPKTSFTKNNTHKNYALIHDEFIVYNPKQCKLRYLVFFN